MLTFTSDPMVALKDPALSPLSLPMMLAMQFNNSTATTGKAARSRFVRTVSLAPDRDLAEVVSVLVADLVEVSVLEEADSLAGVDLAVALEIVVHLEAAMVVVVTMQEPELFLLLLIRSPTLPLLVVRGARQSMFAT